MTQPGSSSYIDLAGALLAISCGLLAGMIIGESLFAAARRLAR